MSESRANDSASSGASGPGGLSTSALWASAFVILAMIVVQAGRIPIGPAAVYAGDVSSTGDLTVLTAAGGDNQDVLVVLDRRMERVFVYGVENRSEIRLYESHDLAQMFQSARGAVMGGRPSRP